MSFSSVFSHIFGSPAAQIGLRAGEVALSAFNPGFGSLAEMVANAVVSVESKHGELPGVEKKDAVKHIVDISAPVTLQILQGVSGKTVADPGALAPSLDALIDAIVALFNALGLFPHKAAAPAPVPQAA